MSVKLHWTFPFLFFEFDVFFSIQVSSSELPLPGDFHLLCVFPLLVLQLFYFLVIPLLVLSFYLLFLSLYLFFEAVDFGFPQIVFFLLNYLGVLQKGIYIGAFGGKGTEKQICKDERSEQYFIHNSTVFKQK